MGVEYLGIDLGTTNTIVSYTEDEKVKTLKIGNDSMVPSAIFFESKDKQLFGKKALNKMTTYPECGISLFKRMLNSAETKKIMFRNKENVSQDTFKTYLIDTNVFVRCPNILDRMVAGERVLLPYTVIDELKWREGDPNTKYQAEVAKSSIYKYKEKGNSIITLRESNPDFIPKGCFKSVKTPNDRNDNGILSIALESKHNNEEIIFITMDNGLKTKALENDVKLESLDKFLEEHSMVNTENNDYIELTGQRASAIFLKYIRDEACKKLESDIKKAVITVPAKFSSIEVEATKTAGLDAGFDEIVIMKEPIAAAIVYGIDQDINKKILVYDFGGGTFDVSIIQVRCDGAMDVIGSEGNSKLGGEDITNKIVELINDEVYEKYDINLDSFEISGLSEQEFKYNEVTIRNAAESIKVYLSESQEESLNLINLNIGSNSKGSINKTITREALEKEVLIDISKTAQRTLTKCLDNVNLKMDDIDIIVLAGGSSSVPLFKVHIEKIFGKKPNYEKDVATIVSNGAAIRANQLWGEDNEIPVIYDKTEYDFGVMLEGFTFDCIIPANEDTPASASREYLPYESNQNIVEINVLQRDKGCTKIKTFDDGIEIIDKIIIENLPENINKSSVKVKVDFSIAEEGTLNVNASLVDKDGNSINEGKDIKVTRSSKSDKYN